MRRAILLAAFAVTAGCSQTAALAPVGGQEIADLRYAALDVLVEQKVEILTAPACSGTGAEIKCVGDTVDGQDIVAASTAEDASVMTVSVGSVQIYSGSVQDVLNRNGTGS